MLDARCSLCASPTHSFFLTNDLDHRGFFHRAKMRREPGVVHRISLYPTRTICTASCKPQDEEDEEDGKDGKMASPSLCGCECGG